MKFFAILLVAAAGASIPAAAQLDQWPKIVDPSWVMAERGRANLVLIQAERSRAPYDSGHVEGAQFVATADFTTAKNNVLYELPPTADLVTLLERLGVSNGSTVVIYGDLLASARLAATLDYLGHDRVAILNGGTRAWRDAGLTLETESAKPARPGRFVPHERPEVIATTDWVRDHLQDPQVKLLDARAPNEYSGEQPEEGVARLGHLPGAALLDWHDLVQDGRIKGPDALRQLFRQAGLDSGQTGVTYCRVGSRASLLYLALRSLGAPAKLYDGSLNEWSARPELPVVQGGASTAASRATSAVWETVVVKTGAGVDLAAYRAHLATEWAKSRDQAKRDGLVVEYRVLVGQAQPDDMLQWNVVLVTVFKDDAAKREFDGKNRPNAVREIEGPDGKLARRQYLTLLREP